MSLSRGQNREPSSRLDQLLNEAIELHRNGNLDGAVKGYERVIELAPKHAGALHLLGLGYFQSGQPAKAAPLVQQAIGLEPGLPGAHFNLGLILQSLQRYEEAAPVFEKAIFANRNDVEARINLALALTKLGRNQAAKEQLRTALALRPDHPTANLKMAELEIADKNNGAAAVHFARVISGAPQLIEAYVGLAYALRGLGRDTEASKCCEEGLARDPENPELQFHYAAALHTLARYDEAMEWHRKACARMGEVAMAHFNFAATCYALGRFEETLENYKRALDLGLPPDLAVTAELQSAVALQTLGRDEEADRIYDRIITEQGDGSNGKEAKGLKGLMHLHRGNFSVGWPLYTKYGAGKDAAAYPEPPPFPEWRGQALQGSLYVRGDQGLGDQILYASMIGDARARVSTVLFAVEPRLVDLFARSFPDVSVVPTGTDLSGQNIEAQSSLPGLGQYCRPSWDAFPKRNRGYLIADKARVDELRSRLSGAGGKVVGLSWRSVGSQFSRQKTARLADFLSVLRIPQVRFVDLQYGDTEAERTEFEAATGIRLTHLEDVDNKNDIDGVAALMCACDAVVTVSNTNAHLAGALGRPTCVFAPFGYSRIWYWFEDKKDSPWYSRVTVNHQRSGQAWDSLVSGAFPTIEDLLRSK